MAALGWLPNLSFAGGVGSSGLSFDLPRIGLPMASFSNGFAPRDGPVEVNPYLLRDSVALWAPHIGRTGLQLIDYSPYNHHATITGLAIADWIDTIYGPSPNWDGVNSQAAVLEHGAEWLRLVGKSATFAALINSDSYAVQQHIIGEPFATGADPGYQFGVTDAGKMKFWIGGVVAGRIAEGDITLVAGIWYWLVAIWDDASHSVSFYYNGIFDKTVVLDDISLTYNTGATPVRLCGDGRDGIGFHFNGVTPLIGIWEGVRTDIAALADPLSLLRLAG